MGNSPSSFKTARAGLTAGDASSLSEEVWSDLWGSDGSQPPLGPGDMLNFLTDATHQASYASLLESALTPGGVAVIGTFALDGPERCSGLPVVRRDAQGIAAAMGPGFTLVQAHREVHATPWGSEQPFAFSVLRRR